ncbi:MAG: UDP-N-acetylmuramoyl-tripeptide--D-alanyl-D-alanine ligase [Fibrobacter sp.]|jgi:UDP-N-acetylmuramoyl-tripeptide--D-alanyl-D-alanine ligase|nr:UDP-N-acetylmuramoyl-tripeptide--D-alanyl-D-alanine ligase [Fibrobacter sp.]
MLKLDLTLEEMCRILESEPVGVSSKNLKKKVRLCLDSREAAAGTVFFAIKGTRFDAHEFAPQVMKEGALMSVINSDQVEHLALEAYLPVSDTAEALLKLAKGYQRRFKLKKVAITGSNGKTTTKDMIKAVLSRKFNTHATGGNLNNHIGVPVTLFQLKHSHEAAIIEMGTSGPNEIRPLSLATEPDVAVITNIGASHLERLGTLDNVFKEKLSITAGLRSGGLLILNADDPRLCKVRSTKNYRVMTFGVRRGMFKPENLKWDENACAHFTMGRTKFELSVPGLHNLYNALAAIAVGVSFKIPKSEIALALKKFRASNMRMEVRRGKGFQIVADCYNANPSSTKMALETIGNIENGSRRIAILGDMLELGKDSKKLHYEIGRLVPEMNFDMLLAVGNDAEEFQKGARAGGLSADKALYFKTVAEVNEFLQDHVSRGDLILIKGSRGMKLEQVLDFLLKQEPVLGE